MGELLGLGPVAFVGILLVRVFSEGGGAEALFGLGLFTLLGAYEGAVVGLGQWLVLRRRLPALTRRSWVWATIVGWAAACLLRMLPGAVDALAGTNRESLVEPVDAKFVAVAVGVGAVLGALQATQQWRVLREHVPGAGWWVPANALAWAVAMPLIVLAPDLLLLPAGLLPLLAFAATVVAGAGALVGAIHGVVLMRLLRGV